MLGRNIRRKDGVTQDNEEGFANAVDRDNNAIRVTTHDNITEVESNEGDNTRTSNVNQESLLNEILKELKKMNFHLSILTDITVKNADI